MELQAFLSALEERIAGYDLLCHPYYKAWTAGQLTREDLREYASDYYHHVASFPAYLSALHSRLEDGELRRAVLRNLCDEEIEGRPHSELWLDFAEGIGADRDQVRQREPLPEVPNFVSSRARARQRRRWLRSMRMSRRCRAWPRRRRMAWLNATAPMPRPAATSSCISSPTWSTPMFGMSC
jgi:pyrroloquinoline quinone (PQQ) biosynthesis protein C